MGFKKAKREQLWLKILLAGSSGSGKSYSALRLGTGIAKKSNGKMAAIDTENGRIRYYANEFDFDDLQLEAPYTPEKYVEAINDAVDNDYTVLIVDSITHEWDYCLDVHSKMPGNSYTNWSKITPRHDKLMEKILQSSIHVIATVRGKDEYVLEEKNGKQVPKKVGLGYKQRDNTEYNYTVTFNIDQQTHVASIMKDNTHLFEDRYEVLTEKDGENLFAWANDGEVVIPKKKEKSKTEEPVNEIIEEQNEEIPDIEKEEDEEVNFDDDAQEGDLSRDDLLKLITDKGKKLSAENKKTFSGLVKKAIGTPNYNKCEDIEKLNEILEIVNSL